MLHLICAVPCKVKLLHLFAWSSNQNLSFNGKIAILRRLLNDTVLLLNCKFCIWNMFSFMKHILT